MKIQLRKNKKSTQVCYTLKNNFDSAFQDQLSALLKYMLVVH